MMYFRRQTLKELILTVKKLGTVIDFRSSVCLHNNNEASADSLFQKVCSQVELSHTCREAETAEAGTVATATRKTTSHRSRRNEARVRD